MSRVSTNPSEPIASYLNKGTTGAPSALPIERLKGVADVYGERFRSVGIETVEDFLQANFAAIKNPTVAAWAATYGATQTAMRRDLYAPIGAPLDAAAVQQLSGDALRVAAEQALGHETNLWASLLASDRPWDDLFGKGVRKIEQVFATTAALAEPMAGYYTRQILHGYSGSTADDMSRIRFSDAQRIRVAREIETHLDYVMPSLREHAIQPRGLYKVMDAIAKLSSAVPGLVDTLSDTQVQKLSALLRAFTQSDDGWLLDEIASCAEALAPRLDSQTRTFVTEYLSSEIGYKIGFLRAADLPVPRADRDALIEASAVGFGNVLDDSALFRCEEWARARLKVLHDIVPPADRSAVFSKLAEKTGSARLTGLTLEYATTEGETADWQQPALRIAIGGQPFDLSGSEPASAAPVYKPLGLTDREEAVAAFIEDFEDPLNGSIAFCDEAGDQALLALTDPKYRDRLFPIWRRLVDTERGHGVLYLTRDLLGRLQPHFPKEVSEIAGMFVPVLHQLIDDERATYKEGEHGSTDSPLDYIHYFQSPVFSDVQRVRLNTHALQKSAQLLDGQLEEFTKGRAERELPNDWYYAWYHRACTVLNAALDQPAPEPNPVVAEAFARRYNSSIDLRADFDEKLADQSVSGLVAGDGYREENPAVLAAYDDYLALQPSPRAQS